MIERLDSSCGKIFSKVSELGLEENTIVIFISDNGGQHTYAAQTPLRAGKGWLYEGGIREPLIVKWKNVDGKSFVPVLKNPASEIHQNLFWHYPHYHGSEMVPGSAIRSGKWKLVEWYEKSLLDGNEPAFELYNLESDISESVNLVDSLKTLTKNLSGDLQRWREDVNAQMPVPNDI